MRSRSKVWYLQRVHLFRSLSKKEIEEVAQLLGDHYLPAGTELLGGGREDHVCIIKDGVVRIHTNDAGQERTLALLGSGKVFGPSPRLGDERLPPAATTLVPSYVCFASWSMMTKVCIRYPHVVPGMLRELADVAVRAESWRARVGLASPCERLVDLLVELSEEFGQQTSCGRRIPILLTQADLGSMTGLSRETVSRLMAEFDRQGWLVREDGLMCVRDHSALPACGNAASGRRH